MTGFVANPPAPQSPPAATVKADGWFPDIDVNMVRDAMRLRGERFYALDDAQRRLLLEHFDRRVAEVRGKREHREAVALGQHHIKHDEVVHILGGIEQAFLAVERLVDGIGFPQATGEGV